MKLLDFRLPIAFARGAGYRVVPTVLAIACGVALPCAISLGNRAVSASLFEIVDTMAGRAALHVTAGDGALLPDDVAGVVGGVPGVEVATPVVTGVAFATDGSGDLLTVYGVDLGNDAAVRIYEARDEKGMAIDDPLEFLSQPDSIVVTARFAAQRGLRVGDAIELSIPAGVMRFVVRGLLEPSGVATAFGGNLIVMDLFAAEEVFTRRGFASRIDVVLARGADLDAVADAIAANLPPGLRVERPEQRQVDLQAVMRSVQQMLDATGLVALLAAFLVAFNRMSSLFERRTWQIGVLRAVGLRTRTVWLELVKEGALLGMLGVALGLPLGIALGRLILPIIATTTSLAAKTFVPLGAMSIDLATLATSAALGVVAAVLAASLPAWRTANVPVAAVVRGRGIESEARAPRAAAVVRIVVALGIATTIGAQLWTGNPMLGLAATALVVVGVALAARPLLDVARAPVATVLEWLAGPSGRRAAAILTSSPRRAALTIATMGVGLGAVLWLFTLASSFERTLAAAMPGVLRGDLAVGSVHLSHGVLEAPFDERVLAGLARVPGVQAVVGERAIDWRYGGGPIAINAFDAAYFTGGAHGEWTLLGDSRGDAGARVARGEGVLVSTNFAVHVGQGVGDVIELATPSGPLRLEIVGLVQDFLSPRGTIEMSRALYREYWHDDSVIRALVTVADPARVGAVREEIARRFGSAHAVRVLSQGELIAHLAGEVRRGFTPIYVLTAVFLLVVLLGTADTLGASVAERTRELGIIRAVGLRRVVVARIVVLEGLVLGVLGMLLALACGLALAVLWVEATFPSLLGWLIELHLPASQVLGVAALTIAVALLAASLPARSAARLRPALALRWE